MRHSWILIGLVPVFLLSGCSENAAPPTATTAAPTDLKTDAATATPTEPMPGAEPAAATPDAAAPADSAPKAESAETPPTAAADPEFDKLQEGLDIGDAKQQLASIRSLYEQSPTDPQAVAQYINVIGRLGMMQAQAGNLPLAHTGFIKATALLEKAVEGNVIIPQQLMAVVYYNGACATAQQQKPEDAMSLLEKAVAAGYSDMQQLKADSDLEAVRALPGFSEKLTAWEAKATEAALASATADLAAGESFPFTFALTDVAGAPIDLESLKGKVCIVDVWGTWCPPCRAEIPSFIKLQEKFGAQGFQMVGLNEEQSSSPEGKTKLVTDYIAGNGINYPCALITEEVMGQIPEFQGFPTTLFIDKTGKVRLKAVGLHEYAYLESVVSVLLAEETPAAAAPAEPAPAPTAEAPAAPTPEPAEVPAESTPAPTAEATEPKP